MCQFIYHPPLIPLANHPQVYLMDRAKVSQLLDDDPPLFNPPTDSALSTSSSEEEVHEAEGMGSAGVVRAFGKLALRDGDVVRQLALQGCNLQVPAFSFRPIPSSLPFSLVPSSPKKILPSSHPLAHFPTLVPTSLLTRLFHQQLPSLSSSFGSTVLLLGSALFLI